MARRPPPPAAPLPVARIVALYERVSTREQQEEGYSLEAQDASLRAYANRLGMTVGATFVDVESGRKKGREQFGLLLQWLRRQPEGRRIVVADKTDRVYRNLRDWVVLDDLGVELHLVREGAVIAEHSKSAEKFMHGIKVLMAKNYSDNLSEEVKKGLDQKAEAGHYPGRAPLGYINLRVDGKSTLELDAERALLVRGLFELYDGGTHSLQDLCTHAKSAGLRTRAEGILAVSSVHLALRNPLYGGWFKWGGKVYRSSDPAIVSAELWQRVQDRLDGKPMTRPGARGFAFGGFVTCGFCRSAVTPETHKGHVYYRCFRRCQGQSYTREERLRELFGGLVRPLRMSEENARLVAQNLKESRRMIVDEQVQKLTTLRTRFDRLGRLIDKAYEDKLDGRVDDAFFTRKRNEWEMERAELQGEMQRLALVDARALDTALRLFELANRAYDLYIRQEPSQQRLLLDLVTSNCELFDDRVEATYRKPFDILAEMAKAETETPSGSGDPEGVHSVWSGRQDSNLRPPGPEPGALPG